MSAGHTTPVRDVWSLIQARCAERPGAVAVIDGDTTWTYAQLDRASGGYAALLARHGVGPESVVPVVAPRCGQYVAMLLGVLRTGGAFLPLDPATPPGRASEMVTATGATTLLVQPGKEAYAESLTGGPRRVIPAPPTAHLAMPPASRVSRPPDGLAYVMFTSGSTGTPKGAMVTDLGLANHTLAKTADLALTAADAVGFTASLSFDISVWQALTALTVGGRVAVGSTIDVSEPAELIAWVHRQRVTVLELVPSFMAVMLEELTLEPTLVEALSSLRCLIATGEPLPLELASRWHQLCPRAALVNAYGPAECSDDVTHHIVTPAECATGRPPSIGREIRGAEIYLVDAELREVSPGAEGEILIGGECLGRGYIADPVRTATAFIPDHLSGKPGARLYRTGDSGRRAADGTIDFLGRRDRQVKIRGQRVELGDVEAQLRRVPGVMAAAAVMVRDRLSAFVTVTSTEEARVDSAAVLATVRAEAPGYLVPHAVTVLPELPTNDNGKVDYRSLTRRVAANDAAERKVPELPGGAEPALADVAALIAEVLQVPAIGPEEDFFAAGGDSLLAMKLVSLARERFGVTGVSLRELLADPTARGLLAALRAAPPPVPETASQTSVEVIQSLSSGQERLWFLEQLHPSRYVQLIRFRLAFHGALKLAALRHALAAVVHRHEPLRTVFGNDQGKPYASVLPRAEVALEYVDGEDPLDPLRITGDRLSAATDRPPLMVAQLARPTPDRTVLSLVLHHLIADGFSLSVLGEEIGHFYRRYLDGNTDIPPMPSGYGQYVEQERQWLSGQDAEVCEQFWCDQLSGAPHQIDLPLDRPRPDRPDFAAGSVVSWLTPEQSARVRTVARAARATPVMAVTAALYAVLRSLSGTGDLVIGIDTANRTWPGSEQLIGTFVNQLPLRLGPTPESWSFGELLRSVRQRSLEAYTHDRLPFHKIVAAVNPPRKAGRFPLFQVKVTHQGAWRHSLTLPGVRVVPEVLSEPVTDLDLMLDVSEADAGVRLELVYRTELIERDTAAGWLEAVRQVLLTGSTDPTAPLAAPAPHGQGRSGSNRHVRDLPGRRA